jgi:hypothetical protein
MTKPLSYAEDIRLHYDPEKPGSCGRPFSAEIIGSRSSGLPCFFFTSRASKLGGPVVSIGASSPSRLITTESVSGAAGRERTVR